jgi:predicted house-cleaning noncanonical NTP pyrophosphatase (MazG superfamily)
MTRIRYNKLIRDRIPEIITAEGKQFDIEIMPKQEYEQSLRQKLVEEAQEAAQASPEKLIIELADLYEVMDALMAAHGISQRTVLQVQEQRHNDRGGFEQHLKLLWVEEPDAE